MKEIKIENHLRSDGLNCLVRFFRPLFLCFLVYFVFFLYFCSLCLLPLFPISPWSLFHLLLFLLLFRRFCSDLNLPMNVHLHSLLHGSQVLAAGLEVGSLVRVLVPAPDQGVLEVALTVQLCRAGSEVDPLTRTLLHTLNYLWRITDPQNLQDKLRALRHY